MRILMLFHAGQVPAAVAGLHDSRLTNWWQTLQQHPGHQLTSALIDGVEVTYQQAQANTNVIGCAVIEFGSRDDAVSLASTWPELQWGGRIYIHHIIDVPR